MPKSNVNIAIVGATGAVGKVFIDLMKERKFPAQEIRLLASKRSEGKVISVNGQDLTVSATTDDSFKNIDIAFISASADVSREFAPIAVQNGAIVVDDSSAFRLNNGVPLVIPEVNANDLLSHEGITAIPNCSTIQMVVALKPIHDKFKIKRVVVSTYQSVSGSGQTAIEELKKQSFELLEGKEVIPNVYPYQIAFNCLPHIDKFLENGYTKEEMKMVNETRKIMDDDSIQISPTTVRVPVFYSHSEALNVETEGPITASAVRKLLAEQPGICVVDDPENDIYPLATQGEDKNDVFIGRIRDDISRDKAVNFWVVSDNLRKGAALNAVQIAELLIDGD